MDTTPQAQIVWAELTDEQLCLAYAEAEQRKSKAAAAEKRASAVMSDIKDDMLRRMRDAGNTGFKNAVASVVRTTKTNVSCADWPMFYDWLYAKAKALEAAGQSPGQAFGFLQKRIMAGEIESHLADPDNNGAPPPAINILPEFAVRVTLAK